MEVIVFTGTGRAHLYKSLTNPECREGLRAFGEKRNAQFPAERAR